MLVCSFCSVWLAVLLVPCRLALLLFAVAIWFNRATMRCNRFSVFCVWWLIVFTLCAVVRFWRVLQAFTMCCCGGALVCCCGVMVGRLAFVLVFALVAGAVLCCPCWREDGAYMYVNIYLYTVAVGVACGTFSCPCGGIVLVLVADSLCVQMYQVCSVWWCGVVFYG